MNKLFDSYNQIVERAISLGLLSEENKLHYMHACEEEVAFDSTFKPSNISDLQVEQEQLHALLEKSVTGNRSNSGELKSNDSAAVEFKSEKTSSVDNANYNDQLPVTGRSIENFSILDINNFIKMANFNDGDSELSDILKTTQNTSLAELRTVKLNKVRKRPNKNEVVDFQIPIYLGFNGKKVNSKVKRRFSFHERGRFNNDLSVIQNEGKEKAHNYKVLQKTACKECKSKHYFKMNERVNLKNNNNSNLRRSVSNVYESSSQYKNINQNIQGTSSPRRIQKNICCPTVLLTPPTINHGKNRNGFESSMVTNKSGFNPKVNLENFNFKESSMVTNKSGSNPKVNKRNVDSKKKSPSILQSFYHRDVDEKDKHGSKYARFRTSNSRRFAFRPSPDVLESNTVTKLSKNDNSCIRKCLKEYCHYEKPEFPYDDSSSLESTDTEVKERSNQKLININVICQFFPNDSSRSKQNLESEEKYPQPEQIDDEKKTTVSDPESQLPKDRSTRRSKSHFLSKLFSRTGMH